MSRTRPGVVDTEAGPLDYALRIDEIDGLPTLLRVYSCNPA